MPIYQGSDRMAAIYHGDTAIGRIYHGSTLVYDSAGSGPSLTTREQIEAHPAFYSAYDARDYSTLGTGTGGSIGTSPPATGANNIGYIGNIITATLGDYNLYATSSTYRWQVNDTGGLTKGAFRGMQLLWPGGAATGPTNLITVGITGNISSGVIYGHANGVGDSFYYGLATAGSGSASASGVGGTPTLHVNGVETAGSTRAQIAAALDTGDATSVTHRFSGANLGSTTALAFGGWPTNLYVSGAIIPVALIDGDHADAAAAVALAETMAGEIKTFFGINT